MGASSSKTNANITNNQVNINETAISTLQEQINKSVTNSVIKIASECGGNVSLSNLVQLIGVKSDGDININNKQTQEVTANFSCVSESQIQNEGTKAITNAITTAMEGSLSTDVLQMLDSTAKANATQGLGIGAASSKTNQTINTNSETRTGTYINLKNRVENLVETNFSASQVHKCVQNINAQNELTLLGVSTKGKITLENAQAQIVSSVSSCVQKAGVASKLTDALTNDFKTTTKTDQDMKAQAKTTTSASSSAETSFFAGQGGIVMAVVCILCSSLVLVSVYLGLNKADAVGNIMLASKGMQRGGGFDMLDDNTMNYMIIMVGVLIIYMVMRLKYDN